MIGVTSGRYLDYISVSLPDTILLDRSFFFQKFFLEKHFWVGQSGEYGDFH